MTKTIKIGGASGFWGDSEHGPRVLVRDAQIDYLVFDYLAELTMSILSSARAKSPDQGYATDFVGIMAQLLPDISAKRIKVLTNAGGLNPEGCANALREIVDREGLSVRIACVGGDDIIGRVDEFRAANVKDMGSGRPLPDKLLSANAYLGARPVVEALRHGADIVITGRCVDSALALGALVHEFDWSFDDYDRIAAGSLVGHLLECGAQATGGLHTDWEAVEDWANIGYPIAECRSDGSIVMTKPERTGGLVNHAVIGEQMLYEIGDPAAYALPDVVCDFTQVQIETIGPNRVEVRNTRGRAPTGLYKVSCTFPDGFRTTVQLIIVGINAVAKARRTGEELLKRVRAMLRDRQLGDFTETLVEIIGGETAYGPHARASQAREVQLRVSARHPDRQALVLLARELAQAGTSWAPGTTGTGRRAEPTPVVRLFSFLWPAVDVRTSVTIDDVDLDVAPPSGDTLLPVNPFVGPAPASTTPAPCADIDNTVEVPLVTLAWARSGDKGDISNVGVIARTPEAFALLSRELTPDRVRSYLGHAVGGEVRRFELPGICGFNFVMDQALGGGGMASLRADPLGKGMGQILLDLPVRVPRSR